MQHSRVSTLRLMLVQSRVSLYHRAWVCEHALGYVHNHWGAEGRRADSVRLLVVWGGKWDPEVVRMKRLAKQWQKEAEVYAITHALWSSPTSTSGKQGPMSLMRHMLERASVTRRN